MFAIVLPLKAFAYQSLFLLIAIAIEATVLYQRLSQDSRKSLDPSPPITPKQSVQYATSTQLLATVVGWLVFFMFFSTTRILPSDLRVALIDFVFFDQWTEGTATLLILISFVTFFASLAVNHFGLLGLKRILYGAPKSAEDDSGEASEGESDVFRDLRKEPRDFQPQFSALLFANALAYTAILAVLLLRLLFMAYYHPISV